MTDLFVDRAERLRRGAGVCLLLALVALAVLRSQLGTRLDSFTVDEPWHIVAGATYVRSNDFRLNPEHPPLVKLWAGALTGDSFHLRAPGVLNEKSQERDLVEETMFFDNDVQATQTRARVAMWLLHGLLLGVLAFALWRAFGFPWAAGTLAFLALEPSIGAHLPVVMTDLPLALTLTLAAVCAGITLGCWRWRWVAALGIALGLTLGSKHSALAGCAGISVVLAIGALVDSYRKGARIGLDRATKLATAAAIAVLALWAMYGFHFHTGVDGNDAFNRAMPDKIADLKIDHWRNAIDVLDRLHLLPRAYLWGLADTVRSGVEGRGQNEHIVWGGRYLGAPPWFTWPSIVASKVPLALLALSVLGGVMLWRLQLTRTARWTLWSLLGCNLAHLFALMSSQGTYGGIRHALPLVFALAVLAGAAVWRAWQKRSRALGLTVCALFVVGFATTMREPRLWEYHNEFAGGSANAYRYFQNEGVDLGQRFDEIRTFLQQAQPDAKERVYASYWFSEKQAQAAKINYHKRVENLDDDNIAGVYEGYFVYSMRDTIPAPNWDWDPDEIFRNLTLVARVGNAGIWHGRQALPSLRAQSMYWTLLDYIYKQNGSDWALVARRSGEIVELRPQHIGATIELANAQLRLHNAAEAAKAYRGLLAQQKMPLDPLTRKDLETQLARIDSGADTASLPLLRNPWTE